MELLLLSVCGILGVGLHILMKLRDSVTRKTKFNWKLHVINSAISLIVVAVCIIARHDLENIFPITILTIAVVGYMADSIWKNLTTFVGDKLP